MRKGIQNALEMLGKYGCGFLCLCQAFKLSELEIIQKYYECVENGLITKDCYVINWEKLANFLCPYPSRWKVVKAATLDPSCKFWVEYWYNPKTGKHHFKLKDWDGYENSETVREGYIEDYRVFYAA